jgi:hypothetical protein
MAKRNEIEENENEMKINGENGGSEKKKKKKKKKKKQLSAALAKIDRRKLAK